MDLNQQMTANVANVNRLKGKLQALRIRFASAYHAVEIRIVAGEIVAVCDELVAAEREGTHLFVALRQG